MQQYYIEIWAAAPGEDKPSMFRVWDKLPVAQALWDTLNMTGWSMFTPRP